MKNDIVVIKCPVCGTEYLASEIYMPDSFFGKPREVVRNDDGTINFYIGDDMDLNEEFVCESCGTNLMIHANLSFDVKAGEEFEEEYTTEIDKPAKLKLKETDLF